MMRRLLILSVLLALGGCQLALPGIGQTPSGATTTKGVAGEAPVATAAEKPIAGDAISVTSLDAPKDAKKTETKADAADTAKPDTAKPGAAKPDEAKPDPSKAETGISDAPAVEAAPAAIVEIKTPMHLACEKKGGRWSMAGSVKASFCQSETKDGGKSCSASTDCSGYCLSKSRTCAPFAPLMGCNEILDDQGRTLTECVN